MSENDEIDHLERARKLRASEEFVGAGDHFTAAAHRDLSNGTPSVGWYGGGLVNLLRAGLCYRIGDRDDWCANRCQEGHIIATEMADRFCSDQYSNVDNWRSCSVWFEYLGDFCTVGNSGDAAEYYTKAEDIYREHGDPQVWRGEAEYAPLFSFYRSVAGAAGNDPGPVDHINVDRTFTDWLVLKQELLPQAIDDLVATREWNPPTV